MRADTSVHFRTNMTVEKTLKGWLSYVAHKWTTNGPFHINPSKGALLPPDIYKDPVAARLGRMFIPEAVTCH